MFAERGEPVADDERDREHRFEVRLVPTGKGATRARRLELGHGQHLFLTGRVAIGRSVEAAQLIVENAAKARVQEGSARVDDTVELEPHTLRVGIVRDRCRQAMSGSVDQPRLVDLEVGRVEDDLRDGLEHVDGDDRFTAERRRRQVGSQGELVAPRDHGARQSVVVLLGHGGPAYRGR